MLLSMFVGSDVRIDFLDLEPAIHAVPWELLIGNGHILVTRHHENRKYSENQTGSGKPLYPKEPKYNALLPESHHYSNLLHLSSWSCTQPCVLRFRSHDFAVDHGHCLMMLTVNVAGNIDAQAPATTDSTLTRHLMISELISMAWNLR